MMDTVDPAKRHADLPPGFVPLRGQMGFSELVGPMYIRLPKDGRTLAFGFRAEPRHANLGGVVHGGMLVTFMDHTMGAIVHYAAGRKPCSTISLDCNFIAPGRAGDWIEAEGEVVRATSSLIFVNGRVSCGERTLLHAKGIWKVLDKWLGEREPKSKA